MRKASIAPVTALPPKRAPISTLQVEIRPTAERPAIVGPLDVSASCNRRNELCQAPAPASAEPAIHKGDELRANVTLEATPVDLAGSAPLVTTPALRAFVVARDEARTILAEIYGCFTEGFDTRDLNDAKALLNEFRSD
jgi:hypothetical protein